MIAVALALLPIAATAETWRGITVAPEHRCSKYDRDDYSYAQSIELQVIESMGGRIYGPYTGTSFSNRRQTDIEHIVASSEAHDSGMCARSPADRSRFASDLLNLTLASPKVNRYQKSAKDAAEWLPDRNRCWFANRVVEVRRKYKLTIDRREAAALEQVLSSCGSTEMVVHAGPVRQSPASDGEVDFSREPALLSWDTNKNGRISCKEARAHGIAPVPRDHPAYRFMHDADEDGVVCE